MRRNRIGTKGADLYAWDTEDIQQMNGPLAVQEYIQELIRSDAANVKLIITPPNEVDVYVWQYEHLRQFVLELNFLVTQLKGICTSQTCPKMKGSDEWLYFCAAHKKAQECSAIDYMIHNLDSVSNILTNPKTFPSRFSINPNTAMSNFGLIARRLYRYFAHAYFNHRDVFQEFENEMFLCTRFTEFVLKFDLIESNTVVIPREALKQ